MAKQVLATFITSFLLCSIISAQADWTLIHVQSGQAKNTLTLHLPTRSVMFADTIKLHGLSRDSIWHLAYDFMIVNHYMGFWENAFLYSTNEYVDAGLYVDTVRAHLHTISVTYPVALPDGKQVKVFCRVYVEVFPGQLVVSYRNWTTYRSYEPKGLYDTSQPKWKDIPKLPLERRLASRAEPDNAVVLLFAAQTGKRDLAIWTATFRKFVNMDKPPRARKGETGGHPGYPVLVRP